MNLNRIPFNVDAQIFLPLLIALVLGALIGFEREHAVLALPVEGLHMPPAHCRIPSLYLPQVAELNTPRPMEVTGECWL